MSMRQKLLQALQQQWHKTRSICNSTVRVTCQCVASKNPPLLADGPTVNVMCKTMCYVFCFVRQSRVAISVLQTGSVPSD